MDEVPHDQAHRSPRRRPPSSPATCLLTLMAVVAPGTSAKADPPLLDPVWVAAWGPLQEPAMNIVSMVTLPGDFRPGMEVESVNAEDLAAQLKRRPPGRRAVLLRRYCHSFWGYQPDLIRASDGREYMGPWADAACRAIARDWPRILAMTKYCGATIDLLIGDFEEHGPLGTWGATDAQMEAIRRDPRWTQSRAGVSPLAEAMRPLDGLDPGRIKDPRGEAFKQWNLAMSHIVAAYMNEALWIPAKREFPLIGGSNYQGKRTIDRPAPDLNGHQQPADGVFGNGVSPSLYGEASSIVHLFIDPADATRIARNGTQRLLRGPWTSLLLCVQEARSCVRGAPTLAFMPWIANCSYAGDDPSTPFVGFPADPRAYDENVRHAALLGAPTVLWWRSGERSTPEETRRLDRLISEFNQVALGRVKEPADVEPISFLSEVVVSGGQRHDGRWIWRVTASPDVAALREVGTGREWAPTADTLGFWVETPERVAPRWEVARRRAPQAPGS